MSGKQIIEVSKILNFLKKEEDHYNKSLQSMRQELMRLEIEGFSLKASIRQEELKVQHLKKEEKSASVSNYENEGSSPGCSSLTGTSTPNSVKSSKKLFKKPNPSRQKKLKGNENTHNSVSLQNPEVVQRVSSSIDDARYLEPLFLDPNFYGGDNFVEFDD